MMKLWFWQWWIENRVYRARRFVGEWWGLGVLLLLVATLALMEGR